MIAHIISYGQWWLEGPRELSIAIFMWSFGLITGLLWAHHKIVKPMHKHHKEQMDAHRKTHKATGAVKED